MNGITSIEDVNTLLIGKIGSIEKTKRDVEDLLENNYNRLSEPDRKDLHKFKGRLTEKNIGKYLKKLSQSIKDPIIYRRKETLKNLGIKVNKLNDKIFYNDEIDETIRLLNEIEDYGRLFNIVSEKLPSKLISNNIYSVNSWLENIKNDIYNLKRWEGKLKSKEVLDELLEKYIDGRMYIYEFNEFVDKIQKIEDKFNIKIKKEEFSLIDETYDILEKIEEYKEKIGSIDSSSLLGLKDELDNLKIKLENECNKIKKEIYFWKQVLDNENECLSEKNLDILYGKLKDLKDEAKSEFGENVYTVLENLYKNKFFISNPHEFAKELKTIAEYFDNITIENGDDLNKVENVHKATEFLKSINYKIQKKDFKEVDEFLDEYKNIKSEYENMKKDIQYCQKILNKENETIPYDYYELKQKLEGYKKELQEKMGNDFEEIIEFLKGNINDFDVNKETLKNFIIYIRPLIKEVLDV